MGWSSGSSLMAGCISSIKKNVNKPEIRKKIYLDLIREFEALDCNNLFECEFEDAAFDKALEESKA